MDTHLQTYAELVLEYERVSSELTDLKKEYEENTIIQSMNDMKTIYESQKRKLNKMNDIIESLADSNKAIQIMLNILIKNLSNSNLNSSQRFELKTKLEFINEILTESLKTKTEIFYINLD